MSEILQEIVDTAQFYIDELSGGPPGFDCVSFEDPTLCNDTDGACIWVYDINECTDSP